MLHDRVKGKHREREQANTINQCVTREQPKKKVNPTDNAQKAANLGAIFAAVFLTSAILIAGEWERSHIQDRISAAIEVKQAALADKQRELQQAQSQVAAQKMEIHELSGRSGGIQSVDAGPWEKYLATWYSPSGGAGDGKTTFSGVAVKESWTIAVDTREIPLGSLVEVRFADGSDRIYRATDKGSAIVGKHIDIFDWDEQECRRNGVQSVVVRVLVRGK